MGRQSADCNKRNFNPRANGRRKRRQKKEQSGFKKIVYKKISNKKKKKLLHRAAMDKKFVAKLLRENGIETNEIEIEKVKPVKQKKTPVSCLETKEDMDSNSVLVAEQKGFGMEEERGRTKTKSKKPRRRNKSKGAKPKQLMKKKGHQVAPRSQTSGGMEIER
mmetsp:Transcript_22741/g.45751  ORF Transcript_22741/g.45751 Transcript_22741/m.45751 type:complete len:163 (-) Transcript_22741:120-608(-)|eukprot:CAMPEP_0167799908 /NCGR_PEP_ID=MMETSP0111_2-20121227/17377_1 /TAXON_ID=91324 /ORGANISM="Lotharella globosa, Strain CCCM811" /LENGTH=162 /DNA_ID=CAMNT_0007694989 /DNA_START=13 /DNA_END=504 /DNA_ORIENTATION=-